MSSRACPAVIFHFNAVLFNWVLAIGCLTMLNRRWFLGAIAALAMGAPAYADTPDPAVRQIETFYAGLVDTMKAGVGIEARYKKLKPVVEGVFNLPAMTQFAVGPSWDKMSDADRKSLIDAFERMTVANYAKNFARFGGEQFTVDPKTMDRGPDRIVQSTLKPGSGAPVQFTYRMRQADGTWKVIDIFLAGFASELALRRSEFAHTVETEGAAGLLKKINVVSDGLMKS